LSTKYVCNIHKFYEYNAYYLSGLSLNYKFLVWIVVYQRNSLFQFHYGRYSVHWSWEVCLHVFNHFHAIYTFDKYLTLFSAIQQYTWWYNRSKCSNNQQFSFRRILANLFLVSKPIVTVFCYFRNSHSHYLQFIRLRKFSKKVYKQGHNFPTTKLETISNIFSNKWKLFFFFRACMDWKKEKTLFISYIRTKL
jgi:hypothetical protein